MFRTRLLVGVAAVVLASAGGLLGDDKTGDAKATAKARGQLPANWSKLGLTDDQKQKVYTVQSEFRGKIDVLAQQIKQLQKDERGELEKVLTDAQKTRLKEILASKGPADAPAKDSKTTKGPADTSAKDSKTTTDKK